MFFREKKNKSGTTSIQVVEKFDGKNKLIKTIGCSADPVEILKLKKQANQFINSYSGQQVLSFPETDDLELVKNFIQTKVESIQLVGPNLILGKLFDEIGFNVIPDQLFKQLVIARLVYPKSKLAITRYLEDVLNQAIDVDAVYRYMDKFHKSQKELVEQISYDHSKKILGGQIKAVFYDVTTIHFEIEKEDQLRKPGFSKAGKHKHPQVLLGLLVSENAYPLAYDIFEGNKFEGSTFLPVINSFKEKFNLDRLTVVADSGLMSKDNMDQLQENGYEFILGARIKNETQKIKEKILALNLTDGESQFIKKGDLKLIIHYSRKRAKKDKHNRERGLKRLEKEVKSGKLTKDKINKKGYNKYLKLENDIKVSIDYDKFDSDNSWDGLKGYITNSRKHKKTIINNYKQLWQIEKAFRISKTDFKIRPIYHRLQKRIETHICINFVAYKVYKELDRQLKMKRAQTSTDRTIEIVKSMFALVIKHNNKRDIVILNKNQNHNYLLKLFEIELG